MANKKVCKVRYTGGDIIVNTANVWANLSLATDLSLSDVRKGDLIEVGMSGQWGAEASSSFLDVVSIVGGVIMNSWAESVAGEGVAAPVDAHNGLLGWSGVTGIVNRVAGQMPKVVSDSDLTPGGILNMRFRAKTAAAADKTLLANANNYLIIYALNLGQ